MYNKINQYVIHFNFELAFLKRICQRKIISIKQTEIVLGHKDEVSVLFLDNVLVYSQYKYLRTIVKFCFYLVQYRSNNSSISNMLYHRSYENEIALFIKNYQIEVFFNVKCTFHGVTKEAYM